MSKKANPTLIGAFVLGAVALAVASVLMIGGGRLNKSVTRCVMYFEGSVSGLDVGAPVEFRGVQVGLVCDVILVYDASDDSFRIPVYAEIAENSAVTIGGEPLAEHKDMHHLIEIGLKARLQSQSFVTGKTKVVLDFFPDDEIRLVGAGGDVPEIPTLPGAMESIARKLQDLPLEEIVLDTHRAIKGLAKLVNARDTLEIPAAIGETMADLQRLAETMEGAVAPMTESVQDTANAARQSLDMAREALHSIDQTLRAGSPLRMQLLETLSDLSDAAESIGNLADYIERDPGALLHGKSNK